MPILPFILGPDLACEILPRRLLFDSVANGIRCPDDKARCSDEGAIALFAQSEHVLGLPTMRDVRARARHEAGDATLIQFHFAFGRNPADFAVGHCNSKLRVEGFY